MDEVPKIEGASSDGGIGTQVQLNWMQFLIGAVVVVLLIGMVGALIAVGVAWEQSTASKQATFEDLKDQILEQKTAIQSQSEKIDSLTKKVDYTNYLLEQQGK